MLSSLNIGRNLTIQFIPSDVFLSICKVLIFLLMRHPHSGFTSTLLSCSTSRTPVTDVHQMSVQIITFFVICYNSQITLHCNNIFKESKKNFITLNIPVDVTITISFNIFSHNQNAHYEKLYHVARVGTQNRCRHHAMIKGI